MYVYTLSLILFKKFTETLNLVGTYTDIPYFVTLLPEDRKTEIYYHLSGVLYKACGGVFLSRKT